MLLLSSYYNLLIANSNIIFAHCVFLTDVIIIIVLLFSMLDLCPIFTELLGFPGNVWLVTHDVVKACCQVD